jgi:protoheme IX farnesyltransferase
MTTATLVNKTETKSSKGMVRLTEIKELFFELTKFKITFFVAVTTLGGYLLYDGLTDLNFILPTLGVFILAAGASAINEYQEKENDAKMERTKGRPIPSGRISAGSALLFALLLTILGSVLLAFHSLSTLLLGIFTLFWYNAIYTPLKKITAFAIIPGSLVGALPPVIGWVAAGGALTDSGILAFALFMFIWQIPHFWLLLLIYDEQYKDAGYPTLTDSLSHDKIIKMTYFWIFALVLSSSLIYFSGITESLYTLMSIFAAGMITLYLSNNIIKSKTKRTFGKSFLIINLYVLFILTALSLDKII